MNNETRGVLPRLTKLTGGGYVSIMSYKKKGSSDRYTAIWQIKQEISGDNINLNLIKE